MSNSRIGPWHGTFADAAASTIERSTVIAV
jgi:hypothetical protein